LSYKKKGSPKDDPLYRSKKDYFLEISQLIEAPGTATVASQASSASLFVALRVVSDTVEVPPAVVVHLHVQSRLHEARDSVKNAAIAIKVTFFI
jgi:hypothetical protein